MKTHFQNILLSGANLYNEVKMNYYYNILKFLNEYAGKKHNASNNYESAFGQLAYQSAIFLGGHIAEEVEGFEHVGTSKWQNSGNIKDYIWLQFKRPKHKNSLFSISISNVNIGGKYYFKVYLEIADKEYEVAENQLELRQMFCRSIMDVDPPECDFYYEGVQLNPYRSKRLGNKVEVATMNLSRYDKITTNIVVVVEENEDDASILEKLTSAFNLLIPGYDAIFGEGPKEENWIVPCNCERYDIIKAFSKHHELDWHTAPQIKNIKKGDIVYIYVGKPYSRLMYRCEVIKTGLPNREIDDSEFVKVSEDIWKGESFRIRLLDKLDGLDLSLDDLNDHGIAGNIQGARRIEKETLSYVKNNSRPSKLHEMINSEEIQQLASLSEDELESALNTKDDGSCYVFKEAIVKVRKINTAVIDKLKLLYHGACQLCGGNIGFDFGKEIVEAHHIEYFSKTQNNDPSNIIVLCPNCHRLIHSCDPVYHKKECYFEFADNKKLYVKNPGHLKQTVDA